MDDETLPPPRFVFTAKRPLTLQYIGIKAQIPVEPPVELQGDESIELWWFITDGKVSYHHTGSREIEKAIARGEVETAGQPFEGIEKSGD